jgi:hypothetical protein
MKLTMKTTPLSLGAGSGDYKVRLNQEVVSMVHASVARRCSGVDVGRRFAVEAVLRDWLRLNGESDMPPVIPTAPVPPEAITHGSGRLAK